MKFRKLAASLFVGAIAVTGAVVSSSPAHAADIPGFPGCPDLFRSSIFIPGSAGPSGGASAIENVFEQATDTVCFYNGVQFFQGPHGNSRVGPIRWKWVRYTGGWAF